MNNKMQKAVWVVALATLVSTPAYAQAGVSDQYRWLTFTVFAVVIAITMYVCRSAV